MNLVVRPVAVADIAGEMRMLARAVLALLAVTAGACTVTMGSKWRVVDRAGLAEATHERRTFVQLASATPSFRVTVETEERAARASLPAKIAPWMGGDVLPPLPDR